MARLNIRAYRGQIMAKKFWAGLSAIAFCFIISLPASAQDVLTSEKKALIKELMKLLNVTVNSEAFALVSNCMANTFPRSLHVALRRPESMKIVGQVSNLPHRRQVGQVGNLPHNLLRRS
jgi:hypothetical protein